MSTSRRGTEEGAYSRDKMSDPAYKPPPTFSTSAKVAKGGAYRRDTTVLVLDGTSLGTRLQHMVRLFGDGREDRP